MTYIADTHALLWYLQRSSKLTERIENIFDQTEKGKQQILIPTIVIAEAVDIIQKGRAEYTVPKLLKIISEHKSYSVIPFEWETLLEFQRINKKLEMHDRIILASANQWNALILTRDSEIKKYYPEKVIW